MRVFYGNQCGWSHDELAVGQERFNRIYKQGDTLPWFSLLWSGITGPTTLVVEALDTGCPYQGHLSATSIPSVTAQYGELDRSTPPTSRSPTCAPRLPTTEVFVNGQHDSTAKPKPIARSFLNVIPKPHAKMDFFADFRRRANPSPSPT